MIVWNDGLAHGGLSKRPFIPTRFRRRLLYFAHGARFSGHAGSKTAARRLKRYFWWPGLDGDVENWVKQCALCTALRPYPTQAGRPGALSAFAPFDLISLDFVGPMPWFGVGQYILVIIDHYSRFMVAQSTLSPSADFAVSVLDTRFKAFGGAPRIVLSDNMPFHSAAYASTR